MDTKQIEKKGGGVSPLNAHTSVPEKIENERSANGGKGKGGTK